MQVREVLGSIPFRYIVKYVTVLSASVFVVLGAYYIYFSYTSFRDLGESILEELETLAVVYRGQSLDGVNQYIADQLAAPASYRFSYLVTAADGSKIAGDLPARPRYQELDDGWLGFELALQEWDEPVDVDFLARPMAIGDGLQAIVARDYADIVERARLVFTTLLRALIATLALGIVGGFFSAANAINRVERVNRDIARIIGSEPGHRLDVEQEQGYVRALGTMVNELLEQMDTLMLGVRRVADNIAHDLRTPLTRLRNDLSSLRAALPERDAQLSGIVDDCDDLLAAFNASLRISTLEAGSRMTGGADVDVSGLIHDVVDLYEPLAQQAGIGLQLQALPEVHCRGEADLLFQLFANLLDNAIKYTPAGGKIWVGLRAGKGGRGCTVTVADTGPGIPEVERKNVFRRFYRVESSRGEQPGHGLGLSLVQAIVRYHHGAVELADNAPGLRVIVGLP